MSSELDAQGQRIWSAESLRWVIGLYCAFIGAFALIAPHHFAGMPYEGLQPYQTWWAAAALAAGLSLLAVSVLRPRRSLSLLVHGGAGLVLLLLAASFGRTALWTGMTGYGILAAGTAAAGLLSYARPASLEAGRDLFALSMAALGVVNGLSLVGLPRLFQLSYYDIARPHLPMLGLMLFASGLLLVLVHLRPQRVRGLIVAAHLAAGSAFIASGAVISFPRRSWTGILLAWGCGTALALLPWLVQWLARLDTAALRTRLALALAASTSVALILTAAVATSQEERLAVDQVLEARQIEAMAIARNVSDYVYLNAARTATVAALAGRAPLVPGVQQRLLDSAQPAYQDVTAFVTLDPGGEVVARTGRTRVPPAVWRGVARDVRLQARQDIGIRLLREGGHTTLLFTSPILGLRNELAGVLVTVVDSQALARRIGRPATSVYLADGRGQTIASRELTPADLEALDTGGQPYVLPPLPEGWDRQIRERGVLSNPYRLAAFARVPELDWVIAVERPRSAALAGVRRGRDLAFGLLLLVIPLAVLVGTVVARRIARPLGTLADAVAGLTAGTPDVPLAASGISEVDRLSVSFRDMRDRLAERTRESGQLAAELRARAEALADSDRRKDEFLAMLAHELRNPLGAIANAVYVLSEIGPSEPKAARSVAVIQRQVQHLVRMVDDLLDVSRITRGKVELRRQPVDLSEVVQQAVETSRPVVEAREHDLRLTLPPAPLPLHADATRLEQVVSNLLRNAARYTEPGGRIEVEARQAGGEAVLTIRDSGIGIPSGLLPRVFDLFTQGERGLDRSDSGLGIGLTLVRSLVEMHGGRVAARSDGEGKGSEFEIRLPLVPPTPSGLPS
ncbi:MAG TPA: sensor histidine kinase [Thermoanaerobaculia bacterium]|nr:sensor histidine kinase [Thermoanaerobaculia bacterium]